MRRGCRVSEEALGVAEIIGDVHQPQRLGDAEGLLLSADYLESHDAAARCHLPFGQAVLGMILAERVKHARHVPLARQKLRDLGRTAAVFFHPQFESLDALQMQPSIERADRRTGIAEEYLQVILEEVFLAENDSTERPPLAIDIFGRGVDDD